MHRPPATALELIFSMLCMPSGTAATASPQAPVAVPGVVATLNIAFGKPTRMQRLYYRKMYDKMPYADALIFYYDNGLYKIISPGEEHYGSYVIDSDFDARRYTIHYIALPSADWNNTSAYHVLEFDHSAGQGHFLQRAIVPVDGKLPQQHGDYRMATNTLLDPLPVDWEKGDALMPPLPADRSGNTGTAASH